MRFSITLLVLFGVGCADVVKFEDQDLGVGDSDVLFDVGTDSFPDLEDLSNDLHTPEDPFLPPFCDLMSSPVPAVHVNQDFV